MKISRTWAMPNKNTFDIQPIRELVEKYLHGFSIDPFARDCNLAKIRNDLNPNTKAQYHLDAHEFLLLMKKTHSFLIFLEEGLTQTVPFVDSVIFDPPYSPRQVKELYDSIGQTITQQDGQRTHSWTKEKDLIHELLKPGGYFLYFGWDSSAMGKKRGYEIVEILLVCHGAGHHDTICTVERKPL